MIWALLIVIVSFTVVMTIVGIYTTKPKHSQNVETSLPISIRPEEKLPKIDRVRVRFSVPILTQKYRRTYPHPQIAYVDEGPCDWLFFQNNEIPATKELIGVPSGHVIGLSAEPLEFLTFDEKTMEFLNAHVYQYLIGSLPPMPGPWKLHYGYMDYQSPVQRKQWNQKAKIMSIIVGDRIFFPGHEYRHSLAREIIRRKLPVDIWGRGAKQYHEIHPFTMGVFDGLEPYDDYKFTIAIENNTSHCYISEKFTYAIACNCIPIYYGASQVETYFGSDCHFRLTGQIDRDLEIIEAILTEPDRHQYNLDQAHHELKHGRADFSNFVLGLPQKH
jgi:hypothetical protein